MKQLKAGMTFTGTPQCFTGRIEVLQVDEANNTLRVSLTKKNDTLVSNWNEDWNLQHTIWGFERGDYFFKEFNDYPQEKQGKVFQFIDESMDDCLIKDSCLRFGKEGCNLRCPFYM